MSTRSRLGKGLGALFPALPGEALPSETPTSETPLPETAPHGEAKQPAAQAGSKPSGATRSGRKTSGKRASMPSLDTIVHPSDMFFDTTLTQPAAPAPKAKEPEPKVSRETSEAEPEVELQPVQGGYLDELRLDAIVPNAHQPRTIFDEDDLRELSDSIREVGVLQPIVVRRLSPSQYELVMGERRWRASKLAGLETIPAIVKTTSDNDMLRDALLENLHRVALNPLEEAAAYQQMIDEFGLTQQQLSKSISKSRPQIANTLRLLNLPVTVQKKVASGVLSAGHARPIASSARAFRCAAPKRSYQCRWRRRNSPRNAGLMPLILGSDQPFSNRWRIVSIPRCPSKARRSMVALRSCSLLQRIWTAS